MQTFRLCLFLIHLFSVTTYAQIYPIRSAEGDLLLGLGGLDEFCLSNDDRWIASGSEYGVFLWETQTGELLRRFVPPQFGIARAVAFSPDNAQLAAGIYGFGLVVWDIDSGELLYTADNRDMNAILYSHDGNWIAHNSYDGSVWIENAHTGERVAVITGNDAVKDIRFSPDNVYLLVIRYESEEAQLWDWRNGELVKTYAPVSGADISPGGEEIALSSSVEFALADLSSGEILRATDALRRSNRVRYLSEDIIFIDQGRGAVLRDAGTLEPVEGDPALTYFIHGFTRDLSEYVHHQSGFLTRSRTVDRVIEKIYPGHSTHQPDIVISPDSNRVITSYQNSTMWNPLTGAPETHFQVDRLSDAFRPRFSPDGSRVSTMEDRWIYIWDTNTHEIVNEINMENVGKPVDSHWIPGISKYLLVKTYNFDLSVWDIETETMLSQRRNDFAQYSTEVVAPSGSYVAAIHTNGVFMLYDLPFLGLVRQFELDATYPPASVLAFSRDERLVYTCYEGAIHAWSVDTGRLVDEYPIDPEAFIDLQRLSSGELIVLSRRHNPVDSPDESIGSLILSNLQSGDEVTVYERMNLAPIAARVSPDGSYVVTSHQNQPSRVWRLGSLPTSIADWRQYITE